MKTCAEKVIKIGFSRPPKAIFDEVESVTAEMIRQGWYLKDSCIEDGLGFVHLFFEREIDGNITDTIASL
ncbi:MAG TPA: hypothetical protein VHP36_01995 [Chitinispirillaceae bacterium]|nr:hypothetical protein [Chitinispirillaceae bacterium]